MLLLNMQVDYLTLEVGFKSLQGSLINKALRAPFSVIPMGVYRVIPRMPLERCYGCYRGIL